jgi:hypothetical protein
MIAMFCVYVYYLNGETYQNNFKFCSTYWVISSKQTRISAIATNAIQIENVSLFSCSLDLFLGISYNDFLLHHHRYHRRRRRRHYIIINYVSKPIVDVEHCQI